MKAISQTLLASALLAGTAFAPALAQDEVVGTLHVETSPVMVSSGGDFTTVTSDTQLHVGDRIQIASPGKASLTYNNGYVLHYERPGVYSVQLAPAGVGAAGAGTGASALATTSIVLGAAALSAAAVDASGDVVPPIDPVPISP